MSPSIISMKKSKEKKTAAHTELITVVVDTREKRPYQFASFDNVETVRGTLETGDYSLAGFEKQVSVERKELNDLVKSISYKDKERFKRELQRLKDYRFGCVVVEATLGDVVSGKYYSKIDSASVLGLCASICLRYVPIYLCDNRYYAEMWIYRYLKLAHKELMKELAVKTEQ